MAQDYQKVFNLSIYDDKKSSFVFKALSNETRIRILKLLTKKGPTPIQNIAFDLDLPISTISEHITMLLKTGLISIVKQATSRGQSKIVTYQFEQLNLDFINRGEIHIHRDNEIIPIPIGSYYNFDINKYCGIISKDGYIGERDNKSCFYEAERYKAGLIWFDYGYLEYKIPLRKDMLENVASISISLELCSEAPGFNENWKSDIFFSVNGQEIGTFTCPGDYGDRPGRFTPKWWVECTSYGLLKIIEIKNTGTFIDGKQVSNVTIDDLHLEKENLISFTIGVKKDAKNRGGINIFGEDFGDYKQPIILTISYK